MAIKDLFFNILAKDKTGSAFDSVTRNLHGVEGAAASASQRIRRVGEGMTRFGARATAASAPILYAFRDSLKLYDQQARAQAKVEQAVRATGGAAGFTAPKLFEMATGLQDITRFGDEKILNEVTAQLLTFKNISGDAFERAQITAMDLATVLDGDLKSSSIMLGKALNDPVLGLSAMSRAGVTFSKDQQEVIKALATTGRVAEAQALILSELESQYGGQAVAAAQSGLGALAQLSNSWGDLKEDVGAILGELLPPITQFFKTLISGFRALPDPVKKFTVIAGGLGLVLGPLVGVVGLLVIGLTAISAPVLAVGAAIGLLTAAVVAFWPEIVAFKDYTIDAISSVYTWITDKLVAGWQFATTAIPKMVANMVRGVKEWLVDKLRPVFDFVSEKVAMVKGVFFDLYDAVVGHSYIPDMVDGIGAEFARLPAVMVKPATDAADSVDSDFRSMAENVVGNLLNMAREGKLTFKGFASSIIREGMALGDKMINDVFSRISSGAADMFMGLFSGGSAFGGSSSGGGGGGLGGLLGGIGSSIMGMIPGFDRGLDTVVGGRAGIDRNVATMKLSAGENLRVEPKGANSSSRPINVYIQTPNPAAFNASRTQVGAQISRAVAAGGRGR